MKSGNGKPGAPAPRPTPAAGSRAPTQRASSPAPRPQQARPSGRPGAMPGQTQPQSRGMAQASPEVQEEDWFRGFGDANARRTSNYIGPGEYILEIERMERKVAKKPGKKGNQIFICEFSVLKCTLAYEEELDSDNNLIFPASNRPGERVSMVQDVTANEDTALANMKGLFLAIAQNDSPDLLESDISPEDWQSTLLDATRPPGDTCTGHRIRAIGTKRWTQRNNKPITVLTFLPYAAPGQEPAPKASRYNQSEVDPDLQEEDSYQEEEGQDNIPF